MYNENKTIIRLLFNRRPERKMQLLTEMFMKSETTFNRKMFIKGKTTLNKTAYKKRDNS